MAFGIHKMRKQVGKKELKTEYVHLILEDGILIGQYAKDLHITKDIAEKCVKCRLSFIEGESYPTLADITQIAGIRKDGREYLSSDIAIQGVTAGAVLVNSPFSTFIGNFFLKITFTNTIPTQLFSSRASAIKWLQKFKDQ